MRRFYVKAVHRDQISAQTAGARLHPQYRIARGQLEEFNRHIVGFIGIVREFRGRDEPESAQLQ